LPSTKLILRFDDITPGMAWSKFLPFKFELEKIGLRSVLGVVPDSKDPKLNIEEKNRNFFDDIRVFKDYGDTIAQHGLNHRYISNLPGVLGINNRSELCGLNFKEQYEKISKGKQILESQDIWQPYFMAPAHSFDLITLEVLKELNFIAITDGYGFFPYQINGMKFIPQLLSRPLNIGFGYATVCLHINNMNDKQIAETLHSISINRDNFIDFKKVADMKVHNNLAKSSLRLLSRKVIKLYRGSKN